MFSVGVLKRCIFGFGDVESIYIRLSGCASLELLVMPTERFSRVEGKCIEGMNRKDKSARILYYYSVDDARRKIAECPPFSSGCR